MTDSAHRDVEALRRLEARGGWDEADLNDFALIEASLARLEQVERQLDKLGEEWHAVNNRAHAAEARVEQVEQERDVEERFANAYRRQLETAEAALREIADGEQNGTWRVVAAQLRFIARRVIDPPDTAEER